MANICVARYALLGIAILAVALGCASTTVAQPNPFNFGPSFTFPNCWSLRFTQLTQNPTTINSYVFNSAGLTPVTTAWTGVFGTGKPFPAWTAPPANGLVLRYSNIPWGAPTSTSPLVDVYVAYWLEGSANQPPTPPAPPTFPIRLKMFINPTSTTLTSSWRLEEVRLLEFDIYRSSNPATGPTSLDIAMTPAFRDAPLDSRSVRQRLFSDPFNSQTPFSYTSSYPGEWQLPFWAIYNRNSKRGWWFLREDHEIPHTFGSSSSYIGRPTYRDYTSSAAVWQGFSPVRLSVKTTIQGASTVLRFQMSELLRRDLAPRIGTTAPIQYIQSGSTLIEKIDPSISHWGTFVDYYDILMRYKSLVNQACATSSGQPHSNNYQVNRRLYSTLPPLYHGPRPLTTLSGRPVSTLLNDVPLVLVPQGQWSQHVSGGWTSLRSTHVTDIQNYWSTLTTNPTTLATLTNRPVFFYHTAWHGGPWGFPENYKNIRPGYDSLTAWAHTTPMNGIVMGYVAPPFVSSLSTMWSWTGQTDPRLYSPTGSPSLANRGNPPPWLYCWDTSHFDGLVTTLLTSHPLKPGGITTPPSTLVYFDGLHFDGIYPGQRCTYMSHRHASNGTLANDQVAGMRSLLENIYVTPAGAPNLPFFDEEVALECLIDQFDSHAGQDFVDAQNPPFFRMVYGNAARYTLFGTNHLAQVDGYYPPWLDHPIYDLYRLSLLKDGGMVGLLFFDNQGIVSSLHTHYSFMNLTNPPNEPVKPLLRSYVANYSSLLKPVFSGDVVRLPQMTAPPCCLTRIDYRSYSPFIFYKIRAFEPIVKASAFRFWAGANQKAAVVLHNWATTYQTSALPGTVTTVVQTAVFSRAAGSPEMVRFEHTPQQTTQGSFSMQFAQPTHPVEITLDAGPLGLPTNVNRKVWIYELKSTWSATQQTKLLVGELSANGGPASFVVTTKASTLHVLLIE